jgi:serine protease AprX
VSRFCAAGWRSPAFRRQLLLACLATTACAASWAGPATSSVADTGVARPRGGEPVRVVVQKAAGAGAGPERNVARLGGRVTRELPLVRGFAATIPSAAVRSLARSDGVRAVSADRRVSVQGTATSAEVKSVYPKAVRADGAWQRGITGQGVTVALIDTGVSEVAELAPRVVPVRDDRTGAAHRCLNLSGEDHCSDSYGHGTFIGGIIAGDGRGAGGTWSGIAPGARLLSVKVAGRDGATDVSTVIAAIQWVVSFRERYDIRVLNLSLGTDSTQSYRVDPFNYAVERAWAAGITVVVSAGNRGPGGGTVSKPADDPWVVTVGAIDDRGTPGAGDDRLPDFGSRGPTQDGFVKPDVVAPGAHLLSLRAPGSLIDEEFPSPIGGPYRSGSGTSMAAGVVSGTVALVLQANPGLVPDQVKFGLRASARSVASADSNAVGAGLVDALVATTQPPAGRANVGLDRSNGLGSLGDSRGSLLVQVLGPGGLGQTVIDGSRTAQLLLWDPVGFTLRDWTAPSWYSSASGTVGWHDTDWGGHNWGGDHWNGASWYGQPAPEAAYGTGTASSVWYGAWS